MRYRRILFTALWAPVGLDCDRMLYSQRGVTHSKGGAGRETEGGDNRYRKGDFFACLRQASNVLTPSVGPSYGHNLYIWHGLIRKVSPIYTEIQGRGKEKARKGKEPKNGRVDKEKAAE